MSLNGSSPQSSNDAGSPEQQQQAELLSRAAFSEPGHLAKVVETVAGFVSGYEQQREQMPLVQWLAQALSQYPELWPSDAQAAEVAQQLVASSRRIAEHQASLQQHLDKGKSPANWLANQLEQDAEANPELDLSTYAGQVQAMLESANQALLAPLSGQALNAPSASAEPQASVWDEHSRLAIAREINDQASLNAALGTAPATQILAQRAASLIEAQDSSARSHTLAGFFNGPLGCAGDIDARVVVSGGLLVAARSGWLEGWQNVQVEEVAASVHTTLERAKALYQLGQGDVLADAAMDAIENASLVAARSLAEAAQNKGAELGAQWGAKLGAYFGPAGIVIGSTVGAAVGRMAGQAVGQLIEKGRRKIVEVADRVVRRTVEKLKDAGRQVVSGLKDFVTSIFA